MIIVWFVGFCMIAFIVIWVSFDLSVVSVWLSLDVIWLSFDMPLVSVWVSLGVCMTSCMYVCRSCVWFPWVSYMVA